GTAAPGAAATGASPSRCRTSSRPRRSTGRRQSWRTRACASTASRSRGRMHPVPTVAPWQPPLRPSEATARLAAVPTVFLILSIIGAVLIFNAVRPVTFGPLAPLSFFPGWLTSELAPHILVIHVVTVAVLAALGAVEGTSGAVALGLCAFSALGLLWMI